MDNFKIKLLTSDFLELGMCSQASILNSQKLYLSFNDGSMAKYSSNGRGGLLKPVPITRKHPLLGFEIDFYGHVWASSSQGLYLLDSDLQFMQEMIPDNISKADKNSDSMKKVR